MKKLFFTLAIAAISCGAFAQAKPVKASHSHAVAAKTDTVKKTTVVKTKKTASVKKAH